MTVFIHRRFARQVVEGLVARGGAEGASLGRVFARGRKGRHQRLVVGPAEAASYHNMSRTAGGTRLLGDTEKAPCAA